VSTDSTHFTAGVLILEAAYSRDAAFLNQSTCIQIYQFIVNNPGVNFRGICSALTLPVGVVQYHLAVLLRGGLISNRRDGRSRRFFEAKKFSSVEMKIISFLRRETAAKILRILHDEGSEAHGRLARRLNVSSQALTWQMRQLKDEGLVKSMADGKSVKYFLAEEHLPTIGRCIALTV